MADRFKTPSAAIVILLREHDGKTQALLQRRQNTGFADGLWDFSCSGHVEYGESMSAAAAREAEEELGIKIDLSELKFAALVHKREKERDLTYYNCYFVCRNFGGTPQIKESGKCSQLTWFDADDLPQDLICDRREAFKAFLSGVHYLEYGWQ